MKLYDLKIKNAVFFLLSFFFPFICSASCFDEVGRFNSRAISPPTTTPSISYQGPLCQTGTVSPVITNTNSGAGITGTFFSSNPNLIINSATGTINLGATPVGNYQVNYFEQGIGSCSCTVSTPIQILPIPNVSIIGSNTVCQGSILTLTATGALGYSWNSGTGGNLLTITGFVNAVITVTGTALTGCSNAKSISITVKPVPDFDVPQVTVCAGTTTILTATSLVGGLLSYTWNPGALSGSAIVVSPPSSPPNTPTNSPPSLVLYSVIGRSADGCLSPSKSAVLRVSPSYTPVSGFNYPFPLCTNSSDPRPIFDSLFVLGGVFSTEDPDINVNASSGQINFANVLPGVHTVTYALARSGCRVPVENYANVFVNPGGNLISTPDVSILEKTSIALNVSGGTAYNWTPSEYLSCADCENPVATPFETTTFCVTDLVNGCITPACTKVEVLCFSERDFSLPNAFTPNGDKNNDQFCLSGWDYCVSNFKVVIYNRWGEKVFESTNPSFCWDGVYKDALLNSGVYVYAITASVNRENITKKGNITLIR